MHKHFFFTGLLLTLGAQAGATEWQVSATGGNYVNEGKTVATAFQTLQKAESVVKPGDMVLVGDGIYSNADKRDGGAVLDIASTGTADAGITWKARPGHKPTSATRSTATSAICATGPSASTWQPPQGLQRRGGRHQPQQAPVRGRRLRHQPRALRLHHAEPSRRHLFRRRQARHDAVQPRPGLCQAGPQHGGQARQHHAADQRAGRRPGRRPLAGHPGSERRQPFPSALCPARPWRLRPRGRHAHGAAAPEPAAGRRGDQRRPAPLPGDQYSLLQASNPNVLLWALKPAEEGINQGIIARLWNVSKAPATTQLRLTPGVASAQRSTHIETDLEAVPLGADGHVPTRFARQQMQTYRLKLRPAP